ncbi:MAG TPA: M42 family metallopeptidase [Acetomicrobium sp.]|uniref:M42 family metallopeptidase n=1 Tax=Acetomicrobium mobile TaxID=97477 RepID=UPI0026F11F17|nr:M42 family metallopeptidase [Acetomicrobium mobile]HXK98769.1 M42 family metallopeptidase [Acetomicrobium sp.]
MIDLIKELTESYGPSGREEEVQKVVLKHLEGHIDGHRFDPLGNLLVWKKGKSDKKVLLDAHIDEIGLVVTNIDDKGFLRIEPVGGVSPYTYVGHRVRFPKATGVVYYEGETPEEQKKNLSNLTFDHLFVDIGACDRKEAESIVPIGTFGVYDSYFYENGKYLVSKSMDDRIGCAVLVEVFKNLKDPRHTVIGSFSVQEEIGLVGASVAAYDFSPLLCVAVDVTDSADYPKGLKRHAMALGKGPAIKIKDRASISHRKVVELLEQAAQKAGVPYQKEVLTFGGTNAAVLQRTKEGIPSATLSIPTRYVHSPSETVSLSDVEGAVKLLVSFIDLELEL